MSDVKLSTPRLRIVLADDSEQQVQCTNADLVRFDLTRARQKWPSATDAPFLWLTFIAWAALRRTHVIADSVTYEAFADTTQSIENVDDGSGDAVDPSLTAAEPA